MMRSKYFPGNWMGVNQSTCRGSGVAACNRSRSLPYPTHFGSPAVAHKKYSTLCTIKFKNTTHAAKVIASEHSLELQILENIESSCIRKDEKDISEPKVKREWGIGWPNLWLSLCTTACYKPFLVHVIKLLKLPPDSTRILNLKMRKCHFSSRSEALIL